MSLLEVLVVIAIALALVAIAVPSLMSILKLQQRRAAGDLAITYGLLHDEAVMRNATFRIAYHLDADYYEIEVGDASTLIFEDPEQREDAEEEQRRKLRKYTKKQLARGDGPQEESTFMAVAAKFQTKVELPAGTRFRGVYTPQYGELIEPSGDEEDPEDPLIVYTYIFGNGFTEHTVVQLVDVDDEEVGYTIEVEPLSGVVHLHPEIVELRDLDRDRDYPDDPPTDIPELH